MFKYLAFQELHSTGHPLRRESLISESLAARDLASFAVKSLKFPVSTPTVSGLNCLSLGLSSTVVGNLKGVRGTGQENKNIDFKYFKFHFNILNVASVYGNVTGNQSLSVAFYHHLGFKRACILWWYPNCFKSFLEV